MTTKRTQIRKRAGCDPKGKPAFALTLQAVSGWGDVPATIRLKRFLKAALRSYGLKCIECREAERRDEPEEDAQAGRQRSNAQDAITAPQRPNAHDTTQDGTCGSVERGGPVCERDGFPVPVPRSKAVMLARGPRRAAAAGCEASSSRRGSETERKAFPKLVYSP